MFDIVSTTRYFYKHTAVNFSSRLENSVEETIILRCFDSSKKTSTEDEELNENLINKMQPASILVAGDVMVDEYVVGEVERISPE